MSLSVSPADAETAQKSGRGGDQPITRRTSRRPGQPLRLRAGAAILHRLMDRLTTGRLVVVTPEGSRLHRDAGATGGEATLVLHRWRAVRRLLLGGTNGFAEAYIDGDWDCADLPALLGLAARNMAALDAGVDGTEGARLLGRLVHAARSNTRRGSRRNIRAHYDLGNDFYRAWLDDGMSYSSALYTHSDLSLQAAQAAKQDRVLELLDVRDGQAVLEIGCGWGGLAERIAASANCRLLGITLSIEQYALAQARLCRRVLPGAAQIALQDYRGVAGQFDRIVSIEMLEAVGERYWPVFFDTLRQRLAPGGAIVLQVITIAPERFAHYRRNPDFIQRHIFPGGMLPTDALLERQIAAAGLSLGHREHFGASYARTLTEWTTRFADAAQHLEFLGLKESFRRKWRYYLSYCEAGFATGLLDVGLYCITHASPA